MAVVRWALVATLAFAGLLLASADAGAARCPKAEREACRTCYDAALINGVRGADGCSEAESLVTGRQTRVQEANITLGVCKAQAPAVAGTCGSTIRWLNRCLRNRKSDVGQAWTLFKHRARARCGSRAAAAASRARQACLRDAACTCPVTTSSGGLNTPFADTTTTTTTTTTLGTGSTTTTTVTTTTVPANPNGSTCQRECIARVAGNCYARCNSNCKGSQDALGKCQRACRDRQCTDLRAVCAPTDNTDFESNNPGRLDQQYFVCCKGPRADGACDADTPDNIACVSTTTTTTTTQTTTTSTTTTTTRAGVTTTTSAVTTTTVPGGL